MPVSSPEVTLVSFQWYCNLLREEIFITISIKPRIIGWIVTVSKKHFLTETSKPFLGRTIIYFILPIRYLRLKEIQNYSKLHHETVMKAVPGASKALLFFTIM